ncbi:MAG TPA: hypothetical protein VFF67_10090 [Thermoplasmata archaeon]|nr:hypothetical protein [Thermoplasmata archaeon]
MRSGTQNVLDGVVVGLALIVLAQELGYLSLSELTMGLEWLVIGAAAFGLLFGLIGRLRSPKKRWTPPMPPYSEEPPPPEEGEAGSGDPAPETT